MINEGDKAPSITVTATDGSTLNLAAPGQPLVLYFYPKDDTSGCTREAQDFTALAGDYEKAGVKVAGREVDGKRKANDPLFDVRPASGRRLARVPRAWAGAARTRSTS